jgi:hypothetical protein
MKEASCGQNENILFLDFDGTTIPSYYIKALEQLEKVSNNTLKSKDKFGSYFHPDCMNYINQIIVEFNLGIVITSTWKNDMGLSKLQDMWKYRGYKGEIVGITNFSKNLNKRGLEIKEYLNNNPHIDKYIIIDDMSEKFFESEQLNNLIICEPYFGITKIEYNKACKLLK